MQLVLTKPSFSLFSSSFNLTNRKALLACLSIGFFVRLIPELLAFPNPIGFDTIHYAVVMKSGVIWAHWSIFSWLLYSLIVPLYALIPADPFFLLKIVAPLLYGLNVSGIYWFSRKMLGWNLRMGLLAGIFFAVQLASLRISWDLLRNILGLGILLFALPYIKTINTKRGFAFFILLSLLTVFAHAYAAVILIGVVMGFALTAVIKKEICSKVKSLVLAILPALAVFLFSIFLYTLQVSNIAETNIIETSETVAIHPGGLFFLVNYLSINSSVDHYSNYWSLFFSVGTLFVVLYLPYFYFVVKGFFRNSIMSFWSGLLLIGAFGCLVTPFCALDYWHRWMFMLVYPLTFYAVNGFSLLKSKLSSKTSNFSFCFPCKKAAAMILFTLSIGVAYLATPVWLNHANISYSDPSVPLLIDISHYFSTSPTVPYEDVNSVTEAMSWLDENLNEGSCVILHHAFVSWGKLYLGEAHSIVRFEVNVPAAIETALNHDFSHVYFVWWNVPIGWYGVSIPDKFVSMQDFGRISIYLYEGEPITGN